MLSKILRISILRSTWVTLPSALGLSNSEAFDIMKLWSRPGGNYKYGGGIEVQFPIFGSFDIRVFGTLDRYDSPTITWDATSSTSRERSCDPLA